MAKKLTLKQLASRQDTLERQLGEILAILQDLLEPDTPDEPGQIPQTMDRDIDTSRMVGIGVHLQGMDRPIPDMAVARRYMPGIEAMRVGFSLEEIDADGCFTDPEEERAILQWIGAGGTVMPLYASPVLDVIPDAVMTAGPDALRTYINDVVLAEVSEGWRRFALWYAGQPEAVQKAICAVEIFNEPNGYRRAADADRAAPQGYWQHLFADHQIAVARQMAEWWHGPILTALWAYNGQYEPLLIVNDKGETPKGKLEAALGRRMIWSWHFYSDWVKGVADLEAFWQGRLPTIEFAAPSRIIMTETNAGDFRPENDEGQAYLWTRIMHRLLERGVGIMWFSGMNYGSALYWGHDIPLRNPDRLATVIDAAVLVNPDLTYDYSDATTRVRRSPSDPRGGTDTGVHIRVAGPGDDTFTAGNRATFYFGGAGQDTFTISPTHSTWVYGQQGDDTIHAETGPFAIVMMGEGDDTVHLGADRVLIYGAEGADRFVLGDKGAAIIDNFTVGQDRIEVPAGQTVTVAVDGNDLVLTMGTGTCRLLRRGTATLAEVAPGYVEPGEPPVEPSTRSALAYNLAGVTAEGTNFPFLNIAKLNRGWQAGWGADQSHDALQRAGHLDADGYPIRIPPGADKVEGVWDMGYAPARSSRAGRYVLRYDGDGDIYVGLSGTVVSRAPGRIVFDFRADSAMTIGMTRIAEGNHPVNWRICKEDEVVLLDSGEVFRPEWKQIVGMAGVLRFMDWLHVNFPKYSTWAERPKVSDATYTRKGVPFELIAQLSNELGISPWINLPHTVDDDFIRRTAQLFASTLDAAKVSEVRIARSNEDWNFLFPVASWDGDRLQQTWAGDRNQWFQWSIKEAVRFARAWQGGWDSVAGAKPKLIHVREVHIANSWMAEEQFKATLWRQRDPAGFTDPREVFDEIAVATYFGVGVMINAGTRNELLRRVRENPVTAATWLRDMMLDPNAGDSIPRLAGHFRAMKEAITRIQPAGRKIRMTAYEGGTHIQHSFGAGIPPADENALASFLSDFSYSQRMADLYNAWADLWQQWGEGPIMEFNDVQEPTKWGSWAPRRHLRDTNPRQAAVDSFAARPVWWT